MRRPTPAEQVQLQPSLGLVAWRVNVSGKMSTPHSHADVEINCLERGELTYLHAGQLRRVQAGETAVFWGGLPHQCMSSKNSPHGIWLTVPLSLLMSWNLPDNTVDSLLRGTFLCTSHISKIGSHLAPSRMQNWIEDCEGQHSSRAIFLLELEAVFRRLARVAVDLEAAAAAPPISLNRLTLALDYIHRHYQDEVSAQNVAKAANMHEKALMAVFRRRLNMTLGAYVTRLRVAHAQWLLLTTELPVLEVGFAAGFKSAAPFYEAFQRQLAESPGHFRTSTRSPKS